MRCVVLFLVAFGRIHRNGEQDQMTTQLGAFDNDAFVIEKPKRKATPRQLQVLLRMRERDRRWAEARIAGIKKRLAEIGVESREPVW
jgi:hypothetical protein